MLYTCNSVLILIFLRVRTLQASKRILSTPSWSCVCVCVCVCAETHIHVLISSFGRHFWALQKLLLLSRHGQQRRASFFSFQVSYTWPCCITLHVLFSACLSDSHVTSLWFRLSDCCCSSPYSKTLSVAAVFTQNWVLCALLLYHRHIASDGTALTCVWIVKRVCLGVSLAGH